MGGAASEKEREMAEVQEVTTNTFPPVFDPPPPQCQGAVKSMEGIVGDRLLRWEEWRELCVCGGTTKQVWEEHLGILFSLPPLEQEQVHTEHM